MKTSAARLFIATMSLALIESFMASAVPSAERVVVDVDLTRLSMSRAAQEHHAGTPIALHADNPHYFQWRGRPTILITSVVRRTRVDGGGIRTFDAPAYDTDIASPEASVMRTLSSRRR